MSIYCTVKSLFFSISREQWKARSFPLVESWAEIVIEKAKGEGSIFEAFDFSSCNFYWVTKQGISAGRMSVKKLDFLWPPDVSFFSDCVFLPSWVVHTPESTPTCIRTSKNAQRYISRESKENKIKSQNETSVIYSAKNLALKLAFRLNRDTR